MSEKKKEVINSTEETTKETGKTISNDDAQTEKKNGEVKTEEKLNLSKPQDEKEAGDDMDKTIEDHEIKENSDEKSKKEDKNKEPEKDAGTDTKDSTEKESDKEKDAVKESVKEEETKASNKAITQSKRLADAKNAEKEKQEQKENAPASDKKEKEEKPAKKKGGIIALCIILVLLLGAYFTGFWYFSSHFYTDVDINGIDVSDMDESQTKVTLDNFYKAYVLTIHTIDNKELTINSKDIDMQITLHENFQKCFQEQKAYLWFVEIFSHHSFQIPADVTWDQSKLDDIYDDMDILTSEDIVDPVDAYIGSNGQEFTIIEEVIGNRLDEDIFKQQIGACLQNIQAEINLDEAGCYCKPEIYSDSEELIQELESYGDFVKCAITLQLDDLELEPSLEFLDAVLTKKGNSYEVSKEKVDSYVERLAKKYDTVNTERTFIGTYSKKETKILGKSFGYSMDQEKTAEALYDALSDKKASTVEAVFTKKGNTLVGLNDIGDTYIEADLTKQKVVAYKNGRKIAESDCVSGNVSHGTGTCLGLYAIQAKQSPATLRGPMEPKTEIVVQFDEAGNPYETEQTTMEYSYESHVNYWMPFNGGYGLHDADGWRSAYGGNIYFYSGSHGCINLPESFAKKLYETFDVGTPVLVYFEEETENN